MQNDMIIGMIGASGSGKTEIAKNLEKHGYNIIHSYTTREPREKNEWGHTFVNSKDVEFNKFNNNHMVTFKQHNKKERMIAYVYYNNNHYWATTQQYLNKGKSIYIIDPTGFLNLKSWVSIPVIGVLLMAETHSRIDRMNKRGDSNPKIIERIKNDKQSFDIIKTDWVINVDCSLSDAILKTKKLLDSF